MKTLCELFAQQVAHNAMRVAVHDRETAWTYGEVASLAEAAASWLERQGMAPGDRVAMLLPNSAEYVAVYLGILRAGGVVVALNPETTARELRHTLGNSRPVAAFACPKVAGPLSEAAADLEGLGCVVHASDSLNQELPSRCRLVSLNEVFETSSGPLARLPRAGDVAQIIYTSGTTGRPKGVTLSHRNIAANCGSILEYLKLTADDSVLVSLPFFYSYGNSLLFTHLAVGGRLVLAPDTVFWNRALDLMQREDVTGFSGVPSTFAMLLHRSDLQKRAFSRLRYITCAGGALARPLVDRLRRILPGTDIFLMYGQTEATARLSTLLPEDLDVKSGSIGRGIAGVTLEVCDERGHRVEPGIVGEIVARGENVMQGYWEDEGSTRQVLRPEGLRTGDLARVDEDGYIYIVGRKSDIIKSGAHRINPQEIEEALLALEGVAEVAVVGVPSEAWGESPVAFVVRSESTNGLTERDIREHCRTLLPRYKHVREVRFAESLPKTSSGKIKRAELRARVAAYAAGTTSRSGASASRR